MVRLNQDEVDALQRAGVPDQVIADLANADRSSDAVSALLAGLGSQPGIPVRTPPWNAPPYYSIPINFQFVVNLIGGSADFTTGVRLTPFPVGTRTSNCGLDTPLIAEKFPQSWYGVVRAECAVGTVATVGATNAHRETRWSWLKNGIAVPGHLRIAPNASVAQYNATAANAFLSPVAVYGRSDGFVPLWPGDEMSLLASDESGNVATTWTFRFDVRGWMIPLPYGDGRMPDGLNAVR